MQQDPKQAKPNEHESKQRNIGSGKHTDSKIIGNNRNGQHNICMTV